jgi:phosphatidate cytidylyltransferase
VLKHRLLLGPILLLLLIAALWLDQVVDGFAIPAGFPLVHRLGWTGTFPPGLVMLALGLILVPLAARELGAISAAGSVKASRRWMAIAAIAGLVVCAFVPANTNPVHAVALIATVGTLVLVGSLMWHVREKQTHGATAAVGAAMFAFVYLGLMFGFVLALRREHSAWVVAGVLVITKSCDIGAFFTGKAIGRHKLIPWLSPGKTWEGFVGGIALAALVAMGALFLHRKYLGTGDVGSLSYGYAALVGAVLAITGQIGDLMESVLKRDAGMKDSGHSLPGFGGVLDVLDSILLAAPFAFWLLTPAG